MNGFDAADKAIHDILAERGRQDEKWGEQNHDPITYLAILTEEVGEFAQAALDVRFPKPVDEHRPGAGSHEEWLEYTREHLYTEAVHTAAVAFAIVECLNRDLWRWTGGRGT